MIFYFAVFSTLGFLSFIEIFFKVDKKAKRLIEILIVLSCIIISAVRGDGAGDYENYRRLFESTNVHVSLLTSIAQPNMRLSEPIYSSLNYIIKFFGGNFQTLVVFEAVFVNLIVYYITKYIFTDDAISIKTKDYTITVFFIMWSLGLYNIIVIRQTMAVVVCWYSIKYIKNKNLKRYMICLLIAACLHESEIFWLPAYWIYNIDIKSYAKRMKYYLVLFLFVCIGAISVRPLIQYVPGVAGEKVRLYADIGLSDYGLGYSVFFIFFKTLFNIAVILFLVWYLFISVKDSDVFCGIVNIYLMGVGIVLATSFVTNQLSRLSQSYTMISIFLFPFLFKQKSSSSKKMLLYIAFSLYMGLRLYINIHASSVLSLGYPVYWRNNG